MKHSIRMRYTSVLVLALTAIIGCVVLFNCFYLESYVTSQKKKAVQETISLVESYVESGWGDDEEVTLMRMCATNNIGVYVYYIGDSMLPQVKYSMNYNWESLSKRFESYLWGNGIQADEIYEKTDSHVLYRVYDSLMNSTQIECVGKAGSARYIISTSMEGIKESVALTNRFLIYGGIAGAVLGSFLIYFISRRLTRPILQMSSLAEQMSELNFQVHYGGKRQDEIGALGESMNRMSERLETTISELKEANVQLAKDIERKEKIDEMRREFLSNVSHELKTPIALIQGYSEGLKDGIADDDPDSRDFYCDVIIDEAKKMNHIVKRLLNLDELESGNMTLSWEEFDVTELLRGVMQASAVLAGDHTCEVTLDSPEELMVWADEFMLEEVIQNYLSNAYHYVSDPGHIWIRAFRRDDGEVEISVRNTGNQIPEADLDQVWDKFYKVDKARTRSYGGSGIGLSIVKAIMNSHGGSCGVRNCEDGVEFWCRLKPKAEEASEVKPASD